MHQRYIVVILKKLLVIVMEVELFNTNDNLVPSLNTQVRFA